MSEIGDVLANISISCFAFSYLLTLLLEVSRLFFQVPVRWVLIQVITAAGLFAHAIYIGLDISSSLQADATPLASWHAWCVLVSLVVALFYFVLAIRRPHNNIGVFLIPVVLVLVLAAALVKDSGTFTADGALSLWEFIHIGSLLAGTVAVALGFAIGVMYVVQSSRLKKKLPPRAGLRLPSLEWLERNNRRCLFVSTILLAQGLFAGVVMNIIRQVPFEQGVTISSGVLFLWLIAVTLFEYLYKPARQGRKVAYLTMAHFIFLAVVLGYVIFAQHGSEVAS